MMKAHHRNLPHPLLRVGFRYLGPLAPDLMSRLAYRLWFSTRRSASPPRERHWRTLARIDHIEASGRRLTRYQWGSDTQPAILLIHGWNGRGLQLGGFAEALVKAGWRVTAFDAPGHGDSPGKSTNIFDYAEAIRVMADNSAPLAGAIAHSFGVSAVARALNQGLALARLVAIAAPADAEFLVRRFAAQLEIPDRVIAALQTRIAQRFGMDIFMRLSSETMLAGQSLPGLIIHDRNDRDVPVAHAERLQHVWPNSRIIYTEGLGHNRILRDARVIAAALDFLR